MGEETKLSKLKPLFFGRVTRVIAGVITLAIIPLVGPGVLGTIGVIALLVLGVSFIVGGFAGNAGCELTAIPNLLLPRSKRVHFI